MKKNIIILLLSILLISCGSSKDSLNVYSRESGSGTRSAFDHLVKVKDLNPDAAIANNTNIMLTNVSSDENGIGYVSLASVSVNPGVKAIKVNGIDSDSSNYPLARNFLLVYSKKRELSPLANDFIKFVKSDKGNEVIKKSYTSVNDGGKYEPSLLSGTVNISGSSSVSPLLEKLKESYEKLNPSAKINVQTSDSSTGIEQAANEIVDLGMSSRDLKDGEDLNYLIVAADKIAVIVNKNSNKDNISLEELQKLYNK